MAIHLTQHRKGFGPGLTEITRHDETVDPTGIGFAVLKLKAGERRVETAKTETAWLLMDGQIAVEVGNHKADLARTSLFDESPSAVHVAAGETARFAAATDVELTVYATANTRRFAPKIFRPQDTANENRGAGQVGDACLRYVRTIFDGNNSDPAAELVLGEVVNFPGRWSSYPPHHHPQPELYHYRFDKPQGYGHAEHGEDVYKVRPNDTLKIFWPHDHSQCAAPGYAMYYAWVIRHLPNNPYTVPEYTAEHRWVTGKDAPFWRPAGPKGNG